MKPTCSYDPRPQAKRERIVRHVRCYSVNQDLRGEPASYLPEREAQDLVEAGFARAVNRGKAIQLIDRKPLRLRDESCRPTEDTMDRFVDGAEGAMAVIEGWNPCLGRA